MILICGKSVARVEITMEINLYDKLKFEFSRPCSLHFSNVFFFYSIVEKNVVIRREKINDLGRKYSYQLSVFHVE